MGALVYFHTYTKVFNMLSYLALFCVCALASDPLRGNFEKYDVSTPKTLNYDEFKKFWINEMDSNHDGVLLPAEFQHGWHHEGYNDDHHSMLFFMEIDSDKTGVIEDHDLRRLFSLFDVNEDDQIEQDSEFTFVWNNMFNNFLDIHHTDGGDDDDRR